MPNGRYVNHAKLKAAQYFVSIGLMKQNPSYIDKAEKYLLSLDQTDGKVKMALGAIYLDKQNYDQAILEFEKSANLPPSELKIKYNSLGLAYIKKGLYDKAEKVLEIAIKIEPNDKFAHNNLGFAYAQQNKFDEAIIHFKGALNIDPSYNNAKKNLLYVEKELSKKPRN